MKPMLSILLAATLSLLASCDAPGEGQKAQAGKALGSSVATALEHFMAEKGHYPETLPELHPKYLTFVPKESGHGDTEGTLFSYAKQLDGSYRLSFSYFGPGANECFLEAPRQPLLWVCRGHY
jgi:hypothetical protein